MDGSNNILTSTTHGPGIDQVLAVHDHATAQTLYHLSDHLGSTVALVDADQQVQGSFSYAAFGATRASTGTAGTRFGFTGRENDLESGLMHYRARAYDPAVGRFLQPDPLSRTPADPRVIGMGYLSRLAAVNHPLPGAMSGSLPTGLPAVAANLQVGLLRNPLGLNGYLYVLNNPLRFTDPLGLEGRKNTLTQNVTIQFGRVMGGRLGQGLGRAIGAAIGGALGGPGGAVIGGGVGEAYGGVIGSGLGAAIGEALSGGSAGD